MTRKDGRLIPKLGDFLTRDYAARIEPYLEWARNPLAILTMAMIAAVLCGLYLHPRALILAAGLGAVLVVGTAWPWLSVRGLSGTLVFSRGRVREGEPVEVCLVVRNRMPWGARGLTIRGEVFDDTSPGGLEFAAGWRRTESRWELTPRRRGDYPGAIPRIASAFPFGLREASVPLAVPSRLLVWPRTFPVGPIPDAASGREGDGLAPRNKAGNAGDLLGVRPYRRGDSLRRIHWPQSARHGHMIVCELEAQAMPWVQVVVDVQPDGHSGSGPESSLEWAIRIAASFAETWIGQGAAVELVVEGQVVLAEGGTVASRRARLLDALARLEPDGRLSLAEVLDQPVCRQFSGGLRVVVATNLAASRLSGRPSGGVAERFVVLKAAGFDPFGPSIKVVPLPIRPWVFVDDPAQVARQVRRARKEASLEP